MEDEQWVFWSWMDVLKKGINAMADEVEEYLKERSEKIKKGTHYEFGYEDGEQLGVPFVISNEGGAPDKYLPEKEFEEGVVGFGVATIPDGEGYRTVIPAKIELWDEDEIDYAIFSFVSSVGEIQNMLYGYDRFFNEENINVHKEIFLKYLTEVIKSHPHLSEALWYRVIRPSFEECVDEERAKTSPVVFVGIYKGLNGHVKWMSMASFKMLQALFMTHEEYTNIVERVKALTKWGEMLWKDDRCSKEMRRALKEIDEVRKEREKNRETAEKLKREDISDSSDLWKETVGMFINSAPAEMREGIEKYGYKTMNMDERNRDEVFDIVDRYGIPFIRGCTDNTIQYIVPAPLKDALLNNGRGKSKDINGIDREMRELGLKEWPDVEEKNPHIIGERIQTRGEAYFVNRAFEEVERTSEDLLEFEEDDEYEI